MTVGVVISIKAANLNDCAGRATGLARVWNDARGGGIKSFAIRKEA